MNLLQIANAMGKSIKFGDLPRYNLLVSKINEMLPPDKHISVLTTGHEFLKTYNTLSNQEQNSLASVIDEDIQVRLEVVSDLALNGISRHHRAMRGVQQNIFTTTVVIFIFALATAMWAYKSHQVFKHVMGDSYKTVFIDGIRFIKSVYTDEEVRKSTGGP